MVYVNTGVSKSITHSSKDILSLAKYYYYFKQDIVREV